MNALQLDKLIAAFRNGRSVKRACRAAGTNSNTFYAMRRDDSEFRASIDAVRVDGLRDRAERARYVAESDLVDHWRARRLLSNAEQYEKRAALVEADS